MASGIALCRIRVEQGLVQKTLCESLDIPSQTRLQWSKAIMERFTRDEASNDEASRPVGEVRDWNLVLRLDGSVSDATDPNLLDSSPLDTDSVPKKTKYPANYQIPASIVDQLSSDSAKVRRTETFALGSILYELNSLRKPFHDKGEEEIQTLYARGDFPDDTWELPNALVILCCWCPEFLKELQPSPTKEPTSFSMREHIKNRPILFSLQVLGGVTALASAAAVPVLGAVGFAAAGPVAGSAAAAWQASIGLVQAGSIFAWCQSAAMGGAAVGGIVAAGCGGGAVLATATAASAVGAVETESTVPVLKEKFRMAWERQESAV